MTGIYQANGLRNRGREVSPPADVTALVPFGADGGPAVAFNGPGFFGMAAIPSTVGRDEGRVRELLGILNYFAAPGGSEEARFLGLGLEGIQHTVEPDGSRVLTDRGKQEIGGDFPNLTNAPLGSIWFPYAPEDGRLMQQTLSVLMQIGIDDPTWGLFSQTGADQGAVLGQLIADRRLAIVTGQQPFEVIDDLIREWRDRGGDRIREEYQEALRRVGR